MIVVLNLGPGQVVLSFGQVHLVFHAGIGSLAFAGGHGFSGRGNGCFGSGLGGYLLLGIFGVQIGVGKPCVVGGFVGTYGSVGIEFVVILDFRPCQEVLGLGQIYLVFYTSLGRLFFGGGYGSLGCGECGRSFGLEASGGFSRGIVSLSGIYVPKIGTLVVARCLIG